MGTHLCFSLKPQVIEWRLVFAYVWQRLFRGVVIRLAMFVSMVVVSDMGCDVECYEKAGNVFCDYVPGCLAIFDDVKQREWMSGSQMCKSSFGRCPQSSKYQNSIPHFRAPILLKGVLCIRRQAYGMNVEFCTVVDISQKSREFIDKAHASKAVRHVFRSVEETLNEATPYCLKCNAKHKLEECVVKPRRHCFCFRVPFQSPKPVGLQCGVLCTRPPCVHIATCCAAFGGGLTNYYRLSL
jgi:hypothetical protein